MYSQGKDKILNNIIIFKGVLRGIVILLLLSSIKAVFSRYFFALELSTLNTILIVENIFIIVYLGFYVACNVENNGWLNGGLTGLIYMVILILLGTISMPVSPGSIFVLVLLGLTAGSVGGIIGINFQV